jgi:hypothetical protein
MRFQGIQNIVFNAIYQILFASMQQGIMACRAVLHSPFVAFLILHRSLFQP